MTSQMDHKFIEGLRKAADDVHRNLWTRFMSQDNVIYDYVGLHGEVMLPTPEECRDYKPNALGWWSPIEDGAFFTGAYLLGQCSWYQMDKSDLRREEIKKLVAGLYKLQDVGNAPGMIARGIGSDGKCHYPASSNDQNIPWIIGLWQYLKTDIPSAPERDECSSRLFRQIKAIEAAEWQIPGEGAGFIRGSMMHIDGLEGSLSSVHLAITTKILAELSHDETASLHHGYMNEKLENGKTRLQIIGEGFHTYTSWHGWFTSTSQYAVRELFRQEKDRSVKEIYRKALKITGEMAAVWINNYKNYLVEKEYVFTPEWRVILPAWQKQKNCNDAEIVATAEVNLWHEASPAVMEEKNTLLEAIPAAWIVMMSEDSELIESNLPEMAQAVMHFNYDKLHYGALFYVENLVQEIIFYLQSHSMVK